MAAIDISRETAGASVLLPKELSNEIWANALDASAVMQLGRQVPIPGTGKTIPIITGDATAEWVDETDEKPISRASLDSKNMTPYKMAVIEPFSDEFRRDLPAVYQELARRLPFSLASLFDRTVFGSTAPGSNFDTLGGIDEVKIGPKPGAVTEGTYAGLIEADSKIADANGLLSGWAVTPKGRGLLLSQVDTTGRPLIAQNIATDGAVNSLLGSPVYTAKGVGAPPIVGIAGDWSSAIWGTVAGISISISEQASITDGTVSVGDVEIPKVLNLWQRNMFAIRVEAEFAFIARDLDHFVKLSSAPRT